jgi:[lysine-biosynthesis-protein LysW]---L-2-aminoadipate ligase
MPPRIGMVYSRVRNDEKMIVEAAQRKNIKLDMIYDEEIVLDIHKKPWDVDAVLERSISFYRSLYVLKFLKIHGIPAVNEYEVALRCGDKTETSLLLAKAGVPTPATRVAFTRESALKALSEVGYPAVLKPTMGSWARLLAKVDNPDMADTILEHKEALHNPLQQIYYIQAYVEKARNGDGHKDIRAFVVGDDVIAAIWRESPHWITNTARGGKATNCPVDDELRNICLKAADAVGGGVLALDVMQLSDGSYTIHEVNHTMEFKNSVTPTGVDIPGRILDYTVAQAKR